MALWRVLHILIMFFAVATLILQIVAVSSAHWKTHDIYLDKFQDGLSYLILRHQMGLLTSRYTLSNHDMEGPVIYTGTKFPMVEREQLMHCATGPSLRYQLTPCTRENMKYDCNCRHFDHWIVLMTFELLSIPCVAFMTVLSIMLKPYYQRYVKTLTFLLSALTFIVILVGFILVFQYWHVEYHFFSRVMPYYLNTVRVMSGLTPIQSSYDQILSPYELGFTTENIYTRAGWSAYVSLGAIIASFVHLILSFLILSLQLKETRNGAYKQVPGYKM